MRIVGYHIIAFGLGFILDMILGDPYCLPHPIRLIGTLISRLEGRLLKKEAAAQEKRKKGRLLVVAVTGSTVCTAAVLLVVSYMVHPCLGIAVETIMTYQTLAENA